MPTDMPLQAIILYPALFAALAVAATIAVLAGRWLLAWVAKRIGRSR